LLAKTLMTMPPAGQVATRPGALLGLRDARERPGWDLGRDDDPAEAEAEGVRDAPVAGVAGRAARPPLATGVMAAAGRGLPPFTAPEHAQAKSPRVARPAASAMNLRRQ